MAAAESGTFEIKGLDRNEQYRILAWGKGFVPAFDEAFYGSSWQQAALARVTPIYACRFKFKSSEGGDLRTSPDLSILTGFGYNRTPGYVSMDPQNEWAQLAGIPDEFRSANRPSGVSIVLIPETECDLTDAVPGAGGSINIPGYFPQHFAEPAALAIGELPTYDVVFAQESTGWGDLSIRIGGFPPIGTGVRVSRPPVLGVVMLGRGAGAPFAAVVKNDSGGVIDIKGVPSGHYRGWFRDTFGFYQTPSPGNEYEFDVDDQMRTEIRFSLPSYGELVFRSTEITGPPLTVELSLLRGKEYVPARRTGNFEYLPASVAFVPDGQYRLSIGPAYRVRDGEGRSIDLTVLAGVRTYVDLIRNH